jgi:hypothetical protein
MKIVISPVGDASSAQLMEVRGRCVALVERCGLPYHLGQPILIQGSIGELFALAERMHGSARDAEGAPRIRTEIQFEDGGAVERLRDGQIELLQAAG